VPGPYKIEVISLVAQGDIKVEEQKAIDMYQPPLNTNRAHHGIGLLPVAATPRREKKQPDLTNPLIKKIVDYQKRYQATYQKNYYVAKKPIILQKAANYNRLNNARIRQQRAITDKQTLDEKRYYCDCCDLKCRSPSELKKHNLSARHLLVFV